VIFEQIRVPDLSGPNPVELHLQISNAAFPSAAIDDAMDCDLCVEGCRRWAIRSFIDWQLRSRHDNSPAKLIANASNGPSALSPCGSVHQAVEPSRETPKNRYREEPQGV